MITEATDRKFPIGPLILQNDYSKEEMNRIIDIIQTIPADYRKATENLSESDLAKTYRDGSWNVRQIIHHVADIQYLHYFRLKKAITEPDYESPTLIDMDAWAATPDSLTAPIEWSLRTIESVHDRYAFLASVLTEEQLNIAYFHPIRKIWFTQKQALAMSVWHATHHLAHIRLAVGSHQ